MSVLPTVFFICWTTVNYVQSDDDDRYHHNIVSILIKQYMRISNYTIQQFIHLFIYLSNLYSHPSHKHMIPNGLQQS